MTLFIWAHPIGDLDVEILSAGVSSIVVFGAGMVALFGCALRYCGGIVVRIPLYAVPVLAILNIVQVVVSGVPFYAVVQIYLALSTALAGLSVMPICVLGSHLQFTAALLSVGAEAVAAHPVIAFAAVAVVTASTVIAIIGSVTLLFFWRLFPTSPGMLSFLSFVLLFILLGVVVVVATSIVRDGVKAAVCQWWRNARPIHPVSLIWEWIRSLPADFRHDWNRLDVPADIDQARAPAADGVVPAQHRIPYFPCSLGEKRRLLREHGAALWACGVIVDLALIAAFTLGGAALTAARRLLQEPRLLNIATVSCVAPLVVIAMIEAVCVHAAVRTAFLCFVADPGALGVCRPARLAALREAWARI